MRIIQVQTQAEAAGAQRVSDMVGEGLRALGHDVRTVFMYRKTDVYDADPFADFVLRRRPRGLLDQLRAALGLFGYLRQVKPDAVISYQHFGNIFGTIGGRLAGTRRLIVNQSGAPGKHGPRGIAALDMWMGRLGLYDLGIANSAWTAAQFETYPASYRKRLRRIDHGVAGPDHPLDKVASRAAFGLPSNAYLVVSTGRLTVDKNQIALVRALALLPDVHLALAGAGPEEGNLMAAAQAAGVADRFHLVGEIAPSRVYDFLAAGDAYAFASKTETFGLAAVEAAIAGLPIASSDIPVLREVLTTGGNEPAAVFARSDDAAGMAAAIAAIRQPHVAESLSRAGLQLAEKYAPANMCLGYERALASL